MRKLYENGTILTMETREPAEAVLTEDGRILAVGESRELRELAGDAERVDLAGHTLLPAFLDPHSHFTAAANGMLQANLGECVSFAEIQETITAFIRERDIPAGQWVVAQGYDHNLLAEKSHPTLALLDRTAPCNPLLLQHKSGHMGVVNSQGLARLGITPQTPAPSGGVIEVKDGRLTGYLEENAFIQYQKRIPMADLADLMDAYRKAQELYLSHGIATVQEGLLAPQMIPLYQAMLSQHLLRVDLVGYAEEQSRWEVCRAFPDHIRRYRDHFKLGGCKIFLDGSPQGRTAWLRSPYAGEASYCGYPTMTDEQVLSPVRQAGAEGMQLLAHCNGDAACAQLLRCVKQAEGEGIDAAALRPVMIHAQLLGRDQMEAVRRTGILPSFFVAHVYHWGDVHIRNFGMERARFISPAASALRLGIPFTFHQDTPVLPPDMMETVWCAVNRRTRDGALLDGEAVDVWEALRAVTVNGAYQYFEEDRKGTIAPEKSADFTVLDRNPLAVEPMGLREIRVLATIKEDDCLWKAKNC